MPGCKRPLGTLRLPCYHSFPPPSSFPSLVVHTSLHSCSSICVVFDWKPCNNGTLLTSSSSWRCTYIASSHRACCRYPLAVVGKEPTCFRRAIKICIACLHKEYLLSLPRPRNLWVLKVLGPTTGVTSSGGNLAAILGWGDLHLEGDPWGFSVELNKVLQEEHPNSMADFLFYNIFSNTTFISPTNPILTFQRWSSHTIKSS